MRRDVQLFINNERIDLFGWEDINIVDSVQDFRDVGKLFVPFSRKFTVPASKNNNRVFRHYYNQNLLDGFDARFKISAVIKINGEVYKKGRVTLLSSALKNDVAYSYSLVFYENTVDLKTVIGDDLLSELNGFHINLFNLESYDNTSAYSGFQYGYTLGTYAENLYSTALDTDLKPDLVIPFISSSNYYFFDTSTPAGSPIQGDTESRNININESGDIRGLNFRDFRPSLKVKHIIKAIEEKYQFSFDSMMIKSL